MSKREFELDLTSVCVGSGVVQLPLKMQSLFSAGDLPAIVDGEALLLTFSGPRRLAGFKEHFERRGLRSNDKVRFELDVADDRAVSVVAASIKRERTKPTPQRAASEHGASAEGQGNAVTEQPAAGQVGSRWGTTDGGGQVRAVRKVRVEGGLPRPISPATQQFTAPQRSAAPRRSDPRAADTTAAGFRGWTPLDGLSPDGDHQPPSLHDYPDATVREVRRSRASTTSADEATTPTVGLETAWATAATEQPLPPLYSHGSEVTDQYGYASRGPTEASVTPRVSSLPGPSSRRESDAVRPEPEAVEHVAASPSRQPAEAHVVRTVSQPTGETTPSHVQLNGAFAAPRIPVPRNTAAGSTWQPTPASDLSAPEPSEVVRQPRLIDEMDLAPVRAHADAPARPYQSVQRSQPGEHDQPLRDGAAQQHTFMNQSPTPLAHAPVTNPIARAIDDAEYGGEYLPSGRSLEAALLESSNGLADRNARNVPSVTENVAKQQPGAQTAPANRSVTASEPARPEPLAGPVQSEPVRLEDDLRKVEAYLDRPNTPAIVRSEVVAAELGIDDQRSERALERLSENRDRVSRIRKGAYMVKSSATGHATRY